MLTSEANRAIRENIVTDVNADVFLEGGPQRRLSPEAAILFNKSIVARPLMTPEVCSIRIKNLEYRYRWVFSGGKGHIYAQRKAMGFINATTDDVEVLGGEAHADNGGIVCGDLILMKIRADLYDAAIKWNMQKALILQRTRGMYLNGANNDINADGGRASAAAVGQENYHGKASSFIPTDPNALMQASAQVGGVEAAREQTDEIREKIKADRAKKGLAVED